MSILSKVLLLAAFALTSFQLTANPPHHSHASTFVQTKIKQNIERFMSAARDFDVEMLARMISLGININVCDRSGKRAYYHCVRSFILFRKLFFEAMAATPYERERFKLKRMLRLSVDRYRHVQLFFKQHGSHQLSHAECVLLIDECEWLQRYMKNPMKLSELFKL